MKDYLKFWSICFIVAILIFILDTTLLPIPKKEGKVSVGAPVKIEDMNCPDISAVIGISGVREAYRQYIAGVDECTGRRELSHIIGVDKSDPIVKEANINRYMNYLRTQQ